MTHSDSRPNRTLSDYVDPAVHNVDDLRQAEQALREQVTWGGSGPDSIVAVRAIPAP